MSSELSSSPEMSRKDEEAPSPDIPVLALNELGRLETTETQKRPAVHRAKLAFARNFPRTYRVASKVVLYLRGPRPKRDLERASLFHLHANCLSI